MLNINLFRPITFDNKYILDRYLEAFPQFHSEYSPVTILSWEHYSPCYFAEYKNHLIIDCIYDGKHSFHFPIGDFNPDLVSELVTFAHSLDASISVFDEALLEPISKLFPNLIVEEQDGYFEYCYKSETLAYLPGKKYVGIRGQINKFHREYTYTVENITSKNRPEVLQMIRTWSIDKNAESNYTLSEESRAVSISFSHWDDLNLEGICIRMDDGCIGAASIWETSQTDMVLIHYEKGLKRYPGIFKIINQETARRLKERYVWINREGDMKEPGLRESKRRYHPERFVKAFSLDTHLIDDTTHM
ncbi:MAG TPA: phosphatidylglycerol lysyltransferase domain-containing protein [Methanocorpusculum sp.]|nr:phosphatidylglycerol lysyltransferase domain-containing protein [Methanocorpusculum sp.]HJJ57765.1 phosphatidylglycerol lysyltransferase domain-containing protein [Methanocorpusculum sp.]